MNTICHNAVDAILETVSAHLSPEFAFDNRGQEIVSQFIAQKLAEGHDAELIVVEALAAWGE